MIARCYYCGTDLVQFENWHTDHMIPRSRGGTSHRSNLVDACAACNSSKGNKTVEEFREWLATPHLRVVKDLEQVLGRLRRLPFQRHADLENSIVVLIATYSAMPKKEIVFYHERIVQQVLVSGGIVVSGAATYQRPAPL